MNEKSKEFIICPVCGNRKAKLFQHFHYVCDNCGWDSLENTVDISYSDPLSSPLSNLFPHNFIIHDYSLPIKNISCLSMESFLQSLRVKDPKLQKQVCENYSGYMAYKLRLALGDWRKDGIVYWKGIAISRYSQEYQDLLTSAYDFLFEGNDVFREIILPKFRDKILIHSIGCDSESETLLTEKEYRAQLKRLMLRLDERQKGDA